ncbi:MAG: paraquat-inducible protein A [Halieaceae bacterium]|nr:paraquat-inducible protein A [Halieaceae bacterium]
MQGTIACHACDLLVDVSELKTGQRASCPRCGHSLTRIRKDAHSKVLAYSVAALIALVTANAFPFLSFASSGLESVMTLPQTPAMLWGNGLPMVAILVAAFIIYIPATVLVLLILLCMPLRGERWRPWLKPVGRWVFTLQSWSMVEVFIIGVIVSLVKIMKMATVTMGLSFWGYVFFAILFTMAIAALDKYQMWQEIEALEEQRG